MPIVNTILFSLACTYYTRWLAELLPSARPSQPPSFKTELSCSRGDGQYASCDISGGQYGKETGKEMASHVGLNTENEVMVCEQGDVDTGA